MKKYELIKVKIKKESKEELLKWSDYLNKNIDEVVESLKQENVFLESWFYEEVEDGIWLYCFWIFKNKNTASNTSLVSTLTVDKFHHEFKKKFWIKGTKKILNPILYASQK